MRDETKDCKSFNNAKPHTVLQLEERQQCYCEEAGEPFALRLFTTRTAEF